MHGTHCAGGRQSMRLDGYLSKMSRRWIVALVAALLLVAMPAGAQKKGKKKKADSGEVSLTLRVGKKGKGFTKKQRKHLRKIAKHLKDHPELGQVTIVGHTDSRGKPKMNDKLSLKRAKAVKKVLVKMGVKADRLQVEGKGGSEPKFDNGTKKGRRQNQRVELSVQSTAPPKDQAVAKAEEKPAAQPASTPEVLAAAAAAAATKVSEPAKEEPKALAEAKPAAPAKKEAIAKTAPAAQTKPKSKPVAKAKAKPKPKAKSKPKTKPVVKKPIAPPVVERSNSMGAGVWIAAAATGVSAAGAVALGLAASSKADSLKELFAGTAAYTEARDEASQLALSADIMYGLSAIGLATTIWLLFDDDAKPSGSALKLGAIVTPGLAFIELEMPLGGDAL